MSDKVAISVCMNAGCNVDKAALLMRQLLKCVNVVAYGFKGCIDGMSEDM